MTPALLAIAGLFLLLALILRLTRPRPRCHVCGSLDVREISREPDGFSHAEYGGGGGGGGWSGTRIYYQVTWRCGRCDATWSRRITETN